MMDSRLPNGGNGDGQRDPLGRFRPGCKPGPGNPFNRETAQLRVSLLRAVKAKDVRAIMQALLVKARGGDVVAAREVLDRCIGRPAQSDLLERIENLEEWMRVQGAKL